MQTCSSLDCIIAHFSIGIRSCTFTIIHGHDVHPAQLYSGLESTLYRIDAIQGKPCRQYRKSQPDFQGLASFRSIGLQLCKHQRPTINHRLVGKRCSFNIKINPSQTIGIDNLLISSLESNFIRDHFSHLLVGSTTKRNINIATQGTQIIHLGAHLQIKLLAINFIGGETTPCWFAGSSCSDETKREIFKPLLTSDLGEIQNRPECGVHIRCKNISRPCLGSLCYKFY